MTSPIGPNAPWPPRPVAAVLPHLRELATWYEGDPVALREFYAPNPGWRHELNRPSEVARRGGVRGFLARMWYGRAMPWGAETAGLHIPAAADVASLSSDLLFAEPPTFSIKNATVDAEGKSPRTDRLQYLLNEGGQLAQLAEAGELASAYGSVFLRGVVDKSVADAPFGDAILPQRAIPTWRHGRLVEVTFWADLPGASSTALYRHLERHFVDGGRGYVAHTLWKGTADRLGEKVSLAEHDETRMYLEVPGAEGGVIPTGIDRLDVTHWQNVGPNPRPEFAHTPYGRSDYAGSLTEQDSLDFTWTALMRDVDNGRSILMVPSGYLRSLGPGNGAVFDRESSLYQQVRTSDPDKPLQIEQVQFAIRVAEHSDVAAGLWRVITRSAGLSADAFGEEMDGTAATATEIGARGARTLSTRRKKINYADPALRRHLGVLIELDAAHYSGKGSMRGSEVVSKWPDGVTADQFKAAQTIQALDAARAISTWMKVKTANPDWSDPQVQEEVDRIAGEATPVVLQDPGTFDGAPAGGEGDDGGDEGDGSQQPGEGPPATEGAAASAGAARPA